VLDHYELGFAFEPDLETSEMLRINYDKPGDYSLTGIQNVLRFAITFLAIKTWRARMQMWMARHTSFPRRGMPVTILRTGYPVRQKRDSESILTQ
jgi:hypothetical protein